ncbi:MAG: ankyrin repeat domain-containing protein, partial [Spirochaetia bacterium]|nr:ankyrin repeat domain-containing protein [Spirochaetia bacterium]
MISIFLGAILLAACVSPPAPIEPEQPQTVVQAEATIAELIERGDTAGLQALFKGRERVNQLGPDGRYPLHSAVLKGSPEIVEILLAMGASPDLLDSEGKTALRYAVDRKDDASAKALVAKGASLFLADKAGVSPLDAAIAKGTTAALVDRISVTSKSPKGETPLHVAVDRLSLDAVSTILRLEPDLSARDGAGRTALDSAFLHPNSQDGAAIAELLVSRNASSFIDDFTYFIRAVRDTNYARARFADGATVLHEAVRFDHRGYLSFFLDRGVPPDAKNASGSSALHDAIRLGRLEASRILLTKGADPNARDGLGNTPLHIALPAKEAQPFLDMLLASNADPSIKDKSGNTALHLAVGLGFSPTTIDILLDKGAPLDAANASGDTALAIAVRQRSAPLITRLASRGASMFVRNLKGETALSIALTDGPDATRMLIEASPRNSRDDSGDGPYHHAVRLRAAPEALVVLHELGLDPSARNNVGDTALHLATRANTADQGTTLLLVGADPFATNTAEASPLSIALSATAGPLEWYFSPEVLAAKDSSGNGPLHYAAMAGLPDGAIFLVKKGMIVDARNADGSTPLMLALKKDSTVTVTVLLSLGADSSLRDASGSTALHLAVYWNASECLRLLAKQARNLDPRDFTGKTPLRMAVDASDANATAFLLEQGADPLAPDSAGETALHAAARQVDERYVSAIASKAKRVDVRDDSGATPLLEAVYAENAKTARTLASLGASIHARDASGESPLSYALKKGGPTLNALLDDRTALSSDTDGRSVVRVILEAKPSPDFIELALAAGASPNDRDAFGRSPLHVAAEKAYTDIAARLVAAGSDRFARDAIGSTPAGIALSGGQDLIVALFGSNPDAADTMGETALHYAAASGLEKAAQILLTLGA